MARSTTGVIGGFNELHTEVSAPGVPGWQPSIKPGTRVMLDDGGEAIFLQATQTLLEFSAVQWGAEVISATNPYAARYATTSLASVCPHIAVTQVSVTTGEYFWGVMGGRIRVRLAANCAAGAPLYTTTTDGVLDDAIVTQGAVLGLNAVVGITAAAAALCSGQNIHISRIGV
jgi:hypothetical protein